MQFISAGNDYLDGGFIRSLKGFHLCTFRLRLECRNTFELKTSPMTVDFVSVTHKNAAAE
jgi:hypothetical protein